MLQIEWQFRVVHLLLYDVLLLNLRHAAHLPLVDARGEDPALVLLLTILQLQTRPALVVAACQICGELGNQERRPGSES